MAWQDRPPASFWAFSRPAPLARPFDGFSRGSRPLYLMANNRAGSLDPKMTRRNRRAVFIVTGLAILGLAVGLVLFAMRDNIVFFYSPSDIAEKDIGPGTRIRLGGMVEEGSLKHTGPATISFKVTDFAKAVTVSYTGILPDLFREGQGVVTEGELQPDGSFVAATVLAKHDEKYMPPEVAESLKKAGRWKEGEDTPRPDAASTDGNAP